MSSAKSQSSLKLYGSVTSPFVRRLRLLLGPQTYEFIPVNIFDSAERAEFVKKSPLLKIPVLEMGSQIIWDSRVIYRELTRKGICPELTLEEENLMTAVSDLSDTLVQKFLSKRSNLEWPAGSPIEVSHNERIQNTLKFLNAEILKPNPILSKWNFVTMSLYACMDWIVFRDIVPLDSYPGLEKFLATNENQKNVTMSDPRKTSI